MIEKRSQPRIKVSVCCRVLDADGFSHVAMLKDISWGGAALEVQSPICVPGMQVRVVLPWKDTDELEMHGEVLRTWEKSPGSHGFSVRFSCVTLEDEKRLSQILQLLLQRGDDDGQRRHARVAYRIEILYGDGGDMRATLEDISQGGAMLTILPNPVEVGQSIQLYLGPTFGQAGLTLRARVVRREALMSSGQEFFRVGLVFEHPTLELRGRVSDLLERLVASAAENAVTEAGADAPDEARDPGSTDVESQTEDGAREDQG
jgi:hypothetical protein